VRAKIEVVAFARCAALLRNGVNCRQIVVAGEEFCHSHLSLVEEYGAGRVRAGTVPRRRKNPPLIAVVEPTEMPGRLLVTSGGPDPVNVRTRLAEAAARGADAIEAALLEACTATTGRWAAFECPDCHTKRQVEVPVPDWRARLSAIELLLREGLGRPAQAEELPVGRRPRTVVEVESLSDEELEAIIGSDAEGVQRLVRQRLESLSAETRRVMRAVLNDWEDEPQLPTQPAFAG
jgi:hypothetical protein